MQADAGEDNKPVTDEEIFNVRARLGWMVLRKERRKGGAWRLGFHCEESTTASLHRSINRHHPLTHHDPLTPTTAGEHHRVDDGGADRDAAHVPLPPLRRGLGPQGLPSLRQVPGPSFRHCRAGLCVCVGSCFVLGIVGVCVCGWCVCFVLGGCWGGCQ